MRAGELARAAGVHPETLRYYERRGLLPRPGRSLGGHRDYDDEALTRLLVIKATQRLGFTLGEIQELLAVGSHMRPRPGLRERAEEKITDIDARIRDLEAMRADLVTVSRSGCSDLMECTCENEHPVPFSGLER